jgi:hypothetical protein
MFSDVFRVLMGIKPLTTTSLSWLVLSATGTSCALTTPEISNKGSHFFIAAKVII